MICYRGWADFDISWCSWGQGNWNCSTRAGRGREISKGLASTGRIAHQNQIIYIIYNIIIYIAYSRLSLCFLARFVCSYTYTSSVLTAQLVNMSVKRKRTVLRSASISCVSPQTNTLPSQRQGCLSGGRRQNKYRGNRRNESWNILCSCIDWQALKASFPSSHVGLRADCTLQWLIIASQGTSGIYNTSQAGQELAH